MKNILFYILLILFIYCLLNIVDKLLIIKEYYNNDNDMKQYNVIIAGTCKNVEKYIEQNLKNIDNCGTKFNKYTVIIYENDSTDNTRELLIKNKKSNYIYIFEDNIKEPLRTVRLSNGRNKILDKIIEININNTYQYLIIIDLDDVNQSGSFVKNIDSNFNYKDWDVMTGCQKNSYYDVWALRKKDLLYFDIWKQKNLSDNKKMYDNIYKNISDKKIYNDNDNELIPIDSGFGGIAIYKLSSIPKECKYNGLHENGMEKCEHVDFNRCIKKNGGNVYINPFFHTDD